MGEPEQPAHCADLCHSKQAINSSRVFDCMLSVTMALHIHELHTQIMSWIVYHLVSKPWSVYTSDKISLKKRNGICLKEAYCLDISVFFKFTLTRCHSHKSMRLICCGKYHQLLTRELRNIISLRVKVTSAA